MTPKSQNSNFIDVACAIIEKDGKVLCAQRSESMSLPLKWELPGGKIESFESAEQCIIREICEEIGLSIFVERQLPTFEHEYFGGPKINLIPFICSISNGDILVREHKNVFWCSKLHLIDLDWAEADIRIIDYYLSYF